MCRPLAILHHNFYPAIGICKYCTPTKFILLVFHVKDLVFIFLPALQERFAQNWQKYLGISASRFPPISAGRFADWQI